MDCWRLHPELLPKKSDEKQDINVTDKVANNQHGKGAGPLMILSSGKVVGNPSAQWKEVRDNRGKAKEKVNEGGTKNGKEMVPVKTNATVTMNNQQVQITNKFVALGDDESNEVHGKELAIIEEVQEISHVDVASPSNKRKQGNGKHNTQSGNGNQMATGEVQTTPRSTAGRKKEAAFQQKQQIGNEGEKLNPAAPEFNRSSAGIGSTNGGSEAMVNKPKKTTSQWVQRTFIGNTLVGVNTSCKDTPSQDTMVEMEMANILEIQTNENFLPQMKERVQWSGGKLWSEQREDDSEENEVPVGAKHDEELVLEEKEEEEKSVNGEETVTVTNKEEIAAEKRKIERDNSNDETAVPKEKIDAKEQHTTKQIQEGNTYQLHIKEGVGMDAIDSGGTGDGVVVTGNLEQSRMQDMKEQTLVPNLQHKHDVSVADAQKFKEVEDKDARAGQDLDEESTTQNFQNVARQGDLSPRIVEKAKSAAKERKKHQKENPTVPAGGVQTRRNLSLSLSKQ
ncbi:uncharacterized protein [Nicotiana sylvestris]|uniref:uncharacterized protein n=1 Tax=Nicotiana sylvestris TaxID=4096 RepID=UPI00388C9E04